MGVTYIYINVYFAEHPIYRMLRRIDIHYTFFSFRRIAVIKRISSIKEWLK
jgi:hypothetical protein